MRTKFTALAILILLLYGLNVNGQEFANCNDTSGVFIRAEQGAIYNGSLESYFSNILKDIKFNNRDIIELKVFVTEHGEACCAAVYSKLTEKDVLMLKDSIDNMPNWSPAMQNGYKVNFWVRLKVYKKKGRVEVLYLNKEPLQPKRHF